MAVVIPKGVKINGGRGGQIVCRISILRGEIFLALDTKEQLAIALNNGELAVKIS